MVLKFTSIITIVIALARTGKERMRRVEVMMIDQQKRFKWVRLLCMGFKKIMVRMKFIELRIDDSPLI